MKISVLHRTSENRGDHGADVVVAHDLLPGETVESLVERLMTRKHRGLMQGPGDVIELRLVVEPAP